MKEALVGPLDSQPQPFFARSQFLLCQPLLRMVRQLADDTGRAVHFGDGSR